MEGNAVRGIYPRGGSISTLSLPFSKHEGLHWRPLLTKQAAGIYSTMAESGDHLVIVSSLRCYSVTETGLDWTWRDVKRRCSPPASSTYRRLPESGLNQGSTMSAISGSKMPQNHMLYAYHDLRMSTGQNSSSLCSLIFQLVQAPCLNNSSLEFGMGITLSRVWNDKLWGAPW